jgi:hypothetical protein
MPHESVWYVSRCIIVFVNIPGLLCHLYRKFPVGTKRTKLHEEYVAYMKSIDGNDKPIEYQTFTAMWREEYGNIQIAKKNENFSTCSLCVHLAAAKSKLRTLDVQGHEGHKLATEV